MKQADWDWGEGLPWLGHVTYMGEKRNAYRIVVGKSERKKPLLGRLRYRHEDDNKMDYRSIERELWYGFIWLRIGATGRLYDHTVNFQVLFRVGNFVIVFMTLSHSDRTVSHAVSYSLLTIFAWRSVVGQSFSSL